MKTRVMSKKFISIVLTLALLLTLGAGTFTGSAEQGESDNLLADADVSSWGAYLWNNPANYAKAVLQNTDDSHHGGNSIYNYNVAFQNLYIALPTEAESNYNISFSIKTNNIMYINIFAVTKGADIPWNSNAEIDRSSASLADYSKLDGFTTSEAAWTDISLDLTTSSATDVQYYLNIHFGAGGTSNTATVSDFSLKKIVPVEETLPAVDDIMVIKGNSMRSTGSQALRYKYSVDKAALQEEQEGYTIIEYGYIAVSDKNLEKGELTFTDGALTNTKAIYGVAYEKGVKDIVFDETEDAKIISVALNNIGLSKSSGVVNYDAYASGYTVRPYIVFENAEGDKVYKYGTPYSASVFATMQTILAIDEQTAVDKGYNWATVQQDQAAINEILASVANDADTATELTVGDYYDAYLA